MKLRHFLNHHAQAGLGFTPVHAREAQRALQASGTDDTFVAAHRGPGGGPDATPLAVTLLALAGLGGDPAANARAVTSALYSLPIKGSDTGPEFQPGIVPESGIIPAPTPITPCSITGAVCFGDAMLRVLASRHLAESIETIEVRRGRPFDATITMRDGRRSRFAAAHDAERIKALDARGVFRVVASVGGETLAEMARDIAR